MTNDSMTASNLVFVDNLEAETNPSSQWHGTLAAVDLTQLAAAGADAKVYLNENTYSAKNRLQNEVLGIGFSDQVK